MLMKFTGVLFLFLLFVSTASASTTATGYLQLLRMPQPGEELLFGSYPLNVGPPCTVRFVDYSEDHVPAVPPLVKVYLPDASSLEMLRGHVAIRLSLLEEQCGLHAEEDPSNSSGIFLTATLPGTAGNKYGPYRANWETWFFHSFRITEMGGGSD